MGIIKYKAGNLASVANALERRGAAYFNSDSAEELEKASGIVFPGVGHAGAAMEDLKAKKLDSWLKNTRKPVLGICLGKIGRASCRERVESTEAYTTRIETKREERRDATRQNV